MNQTIRFQHRSNNLLSHAQVIAETGADVRRKAGLLRRAGWHVNTASMGRQVTQVGVIKCTAVNITCTERQPDIAVLPDWEAIR